MKTFTITTFVQDGYHQLLKDEVLDKYGSEFKHDWEFKAKPLTAGDMLKVDAALNRQDELFRADGRGSVEAFSIARSVQIVKVAVQKWNYADESGNPLEINEANIKNLPPDICARLASMIQFPPLPDPDSVAAKK